MSLSLLLLKKLFLHRLFIFDVHKLETLDGDAHDLTTRLQEVSHGGRDDDVVCLKRRNVGVLVHEGELGADSFDDLFGLFLDV